MTSDTDKPELKDCPFCRKAFEEFLKEKSLSPGKGENFWGEEIYEYSDIEGMWHVWQAAWNARADAAPQGDALMIQDYEECLADKRRLIREIDITLNGDNAAKQASLCDILSQIKAEGIRSIHHPDEPPKSVDVKRLKKHITGNEMELGFDSDYRRGEVRGWNDCIDHLAREGYLRTPQPDSAAEALGVNGDWHFKMTEDSTPTNMTLEPVFVESHAQQDSAAEALDWMFNFVDENPRLFRDAEGFKKEYRQAFINQTQGGGE